MNMPWGDRVVEWHARWCTPRLVVALRWTCAACWGGALLLALWR